MIAVKSLPFQTHSKLSSPFPLRRLRFQFVQWSFDALTLDQYMQLHSSALTQYDNHAVGLYYNLLLLSIPLQSLHRIVDSECLIVNAVYDYYTAFTTNEYRYLPHSPRGRHTADSLGAEKLNPKDAAALIRKRIFISNKKLTLFELKKSLNEKEFKLLIVIPVLQQ